MKLGLGVTVYHMVESINDVCRRLSLTRLCPSILRNGNMGTVYSLADEKRRLRLASRNLGGGRWAGRMTRGRMGGICTALMWRAIDLEFMR
jgi:hypothetical protein